MKPDPSDDLTKEQEDYLKDTSMQDADGNAREDATIEEMQEDEEKLEKAFGPDDDP